MENTPQEKPINNNPRALPGIKGFLPGHPGTAPGAGRPKGSKSLKSTLRRFLDMTLIDPELYGIDPSKISRDEGEAIIRKEFGNKITYEEAIMFQMVHMAASGNVYMIREVHDRLEGKAVQPTENKNIDMSYAEYLDSLEEAERRLQEQMFE